MLTDADHEFMRASRREIVAGREFPITLFYTVDGEKDPWTYEPLEPRTEQRNTQAVVTELTTQFKADRVLIGGVDAMMGDLWFSVDITAVSDIFDKVTDAHYDDRDYTVIAQDKKGIGVRNRVEFLGRRTT